MDKVFAFIILLALCTAGLLAALPVATAQATKNTFAVILATPNPVGVNQEVLIVTGITDMTAWPKPGWTGVTVKVERPDGKTITLGPVTTDTTGMTSITYKPDIPGTYYLQTHFPQQVCEVDVVTPFGIVVIPAGTVMKASVSEKLALIVTEEPRKYHPGFPPPQEYWTRPIDAQLREWRYVAGNWLNFKQDFEYYTRYAPFNDYAPEAPHILWQKVLDDGGLVGGIVGGGLGRDKLYGDDLGIISYEHGDAYSGKWQTPVIMDVAT